MLELVLKVVVVVVLKVVEAALTPLRQQVEDHSPRGTAVMSEVSVLKMGEGRTPWDPVLKMGEGRTPWDPVLK